MSRTIKKSFLWFVGFLFFVIFFIIILFNAPLPVKAATGLSGGEQITAGGEYLLTEDATGIIEISTTDSVTIIGNTLGHSDLRIRCTTSGANLSIEDLKITLSSYSYSALSFTAAAIPCT